MTQFVKDRQAKVATILCVDDQPAGLAIRQRLLQAKGYNVLVAADGPSAIALTHEHRVDVVILDYRLPGMDGEEIASILKAENPARPIVLLTGYPGEIPARLMSLADTLVEKGNSATVLLDAVENALRISRQDAGRERPEHRRDSA